MSPFQGEYGDSNSPSRTQMLRVSIHINQEKIIEKSCVNQGETNEEGETKYITHNDEVVWHKRENGAAELAKKLLDKTND